MVTKTSQSAQRLSPKLANVIRQFRQTVEKSGIRCQKILLYGSHRAGTAEEGSDVDLIIISPDWTPYSWLERLELLGVAAARILEPVQAQGFTPKEIEQQELSPFWQYILEHDATVV